jgi:hypothetical protein
MKLNPLYVKLVVLVVMDPMIEMYIDAECIVKNEITTMENVVNHQIIHVVCALNQWAQNLNISNYILCQICQLPLFNLSLNKCLHIRRILPCYFMISRNMKCTNIHPAQKVSGFHVSRETFPQFKMIVKIADFYKEPSMK